MRIAQNRKPYLINLVIVAVVAFAAGSWMAPLDNATAQVSRKSTPPRTFQSGGQLSEKVLKEISVTLKTMDERLKNIESAVQQGSRKR